MPFVFVYGTLKRGKSNHHFLAAQRFVREARTEPLYRLYLLGEYPGMVLDEEQGIPIEGEVWEVDSASLAKLDRLEGTDEGLYTRVRVRLAPANPGEVIETYLYLRSVAGRRDLGSRFAG